ncbi:gephyrin-like molybdotransferase Glp [Desulfonatronospira sp.]|uniref:molybdopterin molybdotransferase MoeA n=1 Tax=Desulfonatronospira sp. TaxID=1962951 RepID=UPI0025BB1A9D|nr:gephyrin-like molybdotransferase Glp [Desulfonatronospira sp.]
MDDFFNVLQIEELTDILQKVPCLEKEELELEHCRGRYLASDVTAPEDLPATNRSCMDGYAVKAADTFGASENNPAYLEKIKDLGICDIPDFAMTPESCAGVVTGGVLPQGSDAVVMQEYTHEMGAGTIEIRRPVAPWENVMFRGEDVTRGDTAIATGQRAGFRHTAMMAALGIKSWLFYKTPGVGIISTGDELMEISSPMQAGRIRDVNSHALAHLVRGCNAEPRLFGIIRDREADLKKALETALETSDVLLISGGSSVGQRDFTLKAMQAIEGLEILAHGLAISPGKPTIFARINNKYVWGLPGQVGSAQVVMLVLVLPFLNHLQGAQHAFNEDETGLVQARLTRNLASRYGRKDYVRVRLGEDEQGFTATPVLGKSGLLKTVFQADGLIWIPSNYEGLARGEKVKVRILP